MIQEPTTVQITADGYAVSAFVGYLALIVGVGIYATRFSSQGVREFFVGGRQMHPFVVALSAVVSGRSAWLLLGVTGMAYAQGASAVWAVVGYIVAELFLFLFYARRLRRFAERYDCVTLPDFFATRFNDTNGLLRGTLAIVILIFMVSYVSSQFVGGGKAFAASFGLTPSTGIWVTAAIVLAYTSMGGFLAVSLTDMLQACFMILALVILPVIAITSAGGMAAMYDQLQALNPALIDPFALSFGVTIGFLGIGLGSPGNPHIIVRYLSIRNAEGLRYAALVGTTWNVIMSWGAVFIGLVGRTYFPDTNMLPGADTENLYPYLAQQHLHPILFGIVVASIFAAIMSTADSQLLVATSSVVRDLYERLLNRGKDIGQRQLVMYSRIVTVVMVGLALALGFAVEGLVFWLVLFAWAGLGAALGPTSILALYWKRTTRHGVLAGLLTGTFTTIIWETSPVLSPLLYELIPAFFLATIATIGVSLLTTPPQSTDEMMTVLQGDT